MGNTRFLENKTVIVTGGAGTLGKAFSYAVAKAGANVVIIGRSLEKAEAFAQELSKQGYQALGLSADVTDKESLDIAAKQILKTYKTIDVLINNAGGNHPEATTQNRFASEADQLAKDFFSMTKDAMDHVLSLNIMGTLLPSQVFASYMHKDSSASIVNISSMSAYKPLTKIPTYSASKAAINNITQWLAVYFASSGIRVNAIAPGFFSSEQNKQLLWNEDGSPTARTKTIIDHTPMKRFGEPEELIGTLLWLLNDKTAGFVTGIVVPVDGGFSAFSGV